MVYLHRQRVGRPKFGSALAAPTSLGVILVGDEWSTDAHSCSVRRQRLAEGKSDGSRGQWVSQGFLGNAMGTDGRISRSGRVESGVKWVLERRLGLSGRRYVGLLHSGPARA